jgi:formamidopyrimidine-DNA glycosylase
MPELPDVAGFQEYLEANVVGKTIDHTSVKDDRILEGVSSHELYPRLKDHSIQSIQRHGKFLFVGLSSGGYLVLHFGMTGEVKAFRNGDDQPSHTRLLLAFKDASNLAYVSKRMLGKVSFTEKRDRFISEQDLGPDALSDRLDRDRFLAILSSRKGNLKAALMDQSLVSGIGNVYADEILFQAGLNPADSIEDLEESDLKHLYPVMRRVLRVGARHQGHSEEYPAGYLLRERFEGGRCPEFHGELTVTKVAGRTTYSCPQCQPRKGS